jgi:hypothetical protein
VTISHVSTRPAAAVSKVPRKPLHLITSLTSELKDELVSGQTASREQNLGVKISSSLELPSITGAPAGVSDKTKSEIREKLPDEIAMVLFLTKSGEKELVPYDRTQFLWVKKMKAPNGYYLRFCDWHSGKPSILDNTNYAIWDKENKCYDTCECKDEITKREQEKTREKNRQHAVNYLLNTEKAIQVHNEFMISKEQFVVDLKKEKELERKIEASKIEIDYNDPTYLSLVQNSERLNQELVSTIQSVEDEYEQKILKGSITESENADEREDNRNEYVDERVSDYREDYSKSRAEISKWINHQKMTSETKNMNSLRLELSEVRHQNDINENIIKQGSERPFYYIYNSYLELKEIVSNSARDTSRNKPTTKTGKNSGNRSISQRIAEEDPLDVVFSVFYTIRSMLQEYIKYIPEKNWDSVYQRLKNTSKLGKECKSKIKIHKGVIKMEFRGAVFGVKTICSNGEIMESTDLPKQLIAITPKRTPSIPVSESRYREEEEDYEDDEKLDKYHEKELEISKSRMRPVI